MEDYRKPYDPFNFMADGNYNLHNHTRITKELYDHYFPYGKKCESCNLLTETIIPECYETCNMWNHWEDGKHLNPRIETRQLQKDEKSIYMSRPTFLFNYYNNIPFIFRCTSMNGLIIHHKNLNKWDDSPENIVIMTSREHSSLHKRYNIIRERINKILKECKNNPSRLKDEELKILNYYIDLLRLISKVNHSFRVNEIIYEVTLAITINQIYIPPLKWAVNTGHTKRTKDILNEKFYNKKETRID
jgi:hypothetical protein